jgi:hypothetical protein
MKDLDGRGIPGTMLATTEFERAANSQAKSIGFMPSIVFVPHPIQNLTREELVKVAENAIEPILANITAGEPKK